MNRLKKIAFCTLFLLGFTGNLPAQIPEQLITFSLSSDMKAIKPGDEGWLLIDFEVKPKWHMYWKNAGQSGYPTTIEWQGDGAEFGPLEFPSPKAYEFLEMVIYVHEGNFTLLCPFSVDDDFNTGDNLMIKGFLSTLVCDEENCIPFDVELSIEIPTGKKSQEIAPNASRVKKVMELWPKPMDVALSARLESDSIVLQISHPSFAEKDSTLFYFFPEDEFFGHSLYQSFSTGTKGDSIELVLPVSVETTIPKNFSGVLTHPEIDSGWLLKWELETIHYGEVSKVESPLINNKVTGDDMGMGILLLMLGMVVLAFAVWLYGKGTSPTVSKKNQMRYRLVSIMIGISGIWMAFPTKDSPSENQIEWGVWSPEMEEKLKSEGRAIYVDYTARWCASCIANKRVYNFDAIIDLFEQKEIVALRADWTDRGSLILEALQSHGRFGVPLNVFYPSGEDGGISKTPVILPEILTQNNLTVAIEEGKVSNIPDELGFSAILGFAALGGLILNLMPCVFPVIGLKIMSFVKHAGEKPSEIRKHGLVFTIGVLLSFWLLVGILLGLREYLTDDLGWGFQLQEPVFVFILAVFLLIFAMSLSGIFEIGMSFTGVGSKLTRTGGISSSFFSGVLATVVATPCMAPFLGVAVGAALTMEWLPAFTVFTFVALGLSTPYLLLSFFPQWMSRLPKPGQWMDTFKQAMAFPLYGTVVWLIWTLQSLL